MSASSPRLLARDLLRRYAREPGAAQALEAGHSLFFHPSAPEAFIAYRRTARAWVSVGEAVGATGDRERIVDAFIDHARRSGRRAVFFAVSSDFTESHALRAIEVAQEALYRPQDWEAQTRSRPSLRAQLRRAQTKGVCIERVSTTWLREELRAGGQVHSLISDWLATRPLPPMGFLVQHDFLSMLEERSVWAARWQGEVVALLVTLPIYPARGEFFEHVLRRPHAPNGSVELLIDAAMRANAASGYSLVTLGMVPLGAASTPPWLKLVARALTSLYNFRGLYAFRAKLGPAYWRPLYLACPLGDSMLLALVEVLRLFAEETFMDFLLAPLRRLTREVSRKSLFTSARMS